MWTPRPIPFQMKMTLRFAVFALIIATSACMSEARKAEQAAKEAKSSRFKKTRYDSMAAALVRFEIAAQSIQPARRRCKATFDTFTGDLKKHGTRSLLDSRTSYENATNRASFNAFEVFGDVWEAGHEALQAILDYTTLTRGSTNELIMLRIKLKTETAKANHAYCEDKANTIKGVFDNLNPTKSTR